MVLESQQLSYIRCIHSKSAVRCSAHTCHTSGLRHPGPGFNCSPPSPLWRFVSNPTTHSYSKRFNYNSKKECTYEVVTFLRQQFLSMKRHANETKQSSVHYMFKFFIMSLGPSSCKNLLNHLCILITGFRLVKPLQRFFSFLT